MTFYFLEVNKMSDEKQKYQCPCGSLVLKANQKQHEKTKKHLNATVHGNFPVTHQLQLRSAGGEQHVKESKKKPHRRSAEPEDFSDDDVEEDDFEDGDNDDIEEGWEEDVSALLEAMNSKLDNLLTALHVDVMKAIDRNEQMEARLAGMLVELKASVTQQHQPSINTTKPYINEKCQ